MNSLLKSEEIRSSAIVPTGEDILDIVESALAEDLRSPTLALTEDLTTYWTIAPNTRAEAQIVAKQQGVVAGVDVASTVFKRLDPSMQCTYRATDGSMVNVGDNVIEIKGFAHPLLTGERTALNFLQRLSGTASLTQKFVEAVHGTGVHITDTRKTTPGLRRLEKYAVCCGGGVSHRSGLYDAVLIKENHAAAAGGVVASVLLAREQLRSANQGKKSDHIRIMVEARNLAEVTKLVAMENFLRPDRILLDNMIKDQIQEAVSIIRPADPPIEIEATGGIDLDNVRDVATTGVDLISIGALTHSAPALDLSLLFK